MFTTWWSEHSTILKYVASLFSYDMKNYIFQYVIFHFSFKFSLRNYFKSSITVHISSALHALQLRKCTCFASWMLAMFKDKSFNWIPFSFVDFGLSFLLHNFSLSDIVHMLYNLRALIYILLISGLLMFYFRFEQ